MTSENDSEVNLNTFIKRKLLKDAKRIKSKYPPISEKVDRFAKSLKIKRVYELGGSLNNLFLIKTKNYDKSPKFRLFLAVLLASQSSDFLVNLAKDFSRKNDLKLIQFSVHPRHFRVGLLSLKEIENKDDLSEIVNLLKNFRTSYRNDLEKLGNLIERV
ncbi:MAG: hypothetical protein ACFE9R_14580 [Candidatus Hermodarchaeota archaeon]